ncbi:MAG: flavin reductase [candidate division Zixibacteria bacterium]|nr:flavin reductase [candidate division Zixibacteria bacterium]
MAFDPMEQRRILGHFATGVTVVTSRNGDELYGMTANAVTSLSLDPPLILVSVDRKAHMHGFLKESKRFAVNILAEEQEDRSRRFAARGPKDFSDLSLIDAVTGSPIFADALAYVDCWLTEVLSGGDHDIFIGEIVAGNAGNGRPLMFYQGKYQKLG